MKSFERIIDMVSWWLDIDENEQVLLRGIDVRHSDGQMCLVITSPATIERDIHGFSLQFRDAIVNCRYATALGYMNEMIYSKLFGRDTDTVLDDMGDALCGQKLFAGLEDKLNDSVVLLAVDGIGYAGIAYSYGVITLLDKHRIYSSWSHFINAKYLTMPRGRRMKRRVCLG